MRPQTFIASATRTQKNIATAKNNDVAKDTVPNAAAIAKDTAIPNATPITKNTSNVQNSVVPNNAIAKDTAVPNNAAIPKDTAAIPQPVRLNDPLAAFKDLFVTASAETAYAVQLNPMAISFVQDYIGHHTKQLTGMKGWGKPYFDMMQNVLNANGLPGELKYLAVIESDLRSNALSWAGAVGPWQFMPATARRMGLRVDAAHDERTDYIKSTHAAAKYLADLYAQYGDWLLVIAAYNGGAGNVNHAIRKSGSKNFWRLQYYLPEESRNHVKKFIATHYIMEGNGSIATLTRDEAKNLRPADRNSQLTPAELSASKTQDITGKFNSLIIAQHIGMGISAFNRYNPDLDRAIAENGTYIIRLPPCKMDLFNQQKNQILEESVRLLLAPLSVPSR
ncbi:MAG TPA: transglycosylase SLT domain-containing protein [Chitinophagaceae bacterium]